jgi:peptidoglycan/LPS O-acetylase OafA/YrhL
VLISWAAGIPGLWNVRTLTIAIILNELYLPVPVPVWAPGEYPYILVPAAWSLFQELLVNMLFAIFWRYLSLRVLIMICSVAACLLVLTSIYYGSLGVGSAWDDMLGGYSRSFFGFSMGVLLYRSNLTTRLPALSAWPLLPFLMFLFWIPTEGVLRTALDPFVDIIVFPIMILIGAASRPKGLSVAIFSFLGTTSYALYVFHEPVFHLVRTGMLKVFHTNLQGFDPWIGFVFLTCMLAGCWLIDKYFDAPVRRWLTRKLRARARQAVPV